MNTVFEISKQLLLTQHELLDIKAELKFAALLRAAIKAGFNEDQPRDEDGRWTDGGSASSVLEGSGTADFIQSIFAGTQNLDFSLGLGDVLSDADPDPIIPGAQYAAANVVRNDRTGNSSIDTTTDRLIQTLGVVSETAGAGAGPLYGIAVHTEFARSIRAQDLPGIGREGVEQSFSMTDTARYGLDGTIRTDVVLRDPDSGNRAPIAVWDVKTGTARLGGSRVEQIRRYLGVGAEVPVIELHVTRGVSNKKNNTKIEVCAHVSMRQGW